MQILIQYPLKSTVRRVMFKYSLATSIYLATEWINKIEYKLNSSLKVFQVLFMGEWGEERERQIVVLQMTDEKCFKSCITHDSLTTREPVYDSRKIKHQNLFVRK